MKPLKISSQALLLAAASAMPFAASAQEVTGNADEENTDNQIVVMGLYEYITSIIHCGTDFDKDELSEVKMN